MSDFNTNAQSALDPVPGFSLPITKVDPESPPRGDITPYWTDDKVAEVMYWHNKLKSSPNEIEYYLKTRFGPEYPIEENKNDVVVDAVVAVPARSYSSRNGRKRGL